MWGRDALHARLPTEKTAWEGKETLPGLNASTDSS